MAQAAMEVASFGRYGLHKEIMESLSALPGMLREVFVRSHYQGMTLSDIAKELRIPQETAQSLLEDADEIFYRRIHKFRI